MNAKHKQPVKGANFLMGILMCKSLRHSCASRVNYCPVSVNVFRTFVLNQESLTKITRVMLDDTLLDAVMDSLPLVDY